MTTAQLEPLARILIDGYFVTADYSHGFREDHGQPPTMLAKVHHHRSIIQATVVGDERYQLGGAYAEFGRVAIEDLAEDRSYLLRSDGTVKIEGIKEQSTLFDSTQYLTSPVTLLVYRFHAAGLDLSIAGTRQRFGRGRIMAAGAPTYVATWPYYSEDHPFTQGEVDPFREVGGLEDEEGEEDSG
jgi:hypothetical protein